MHLVPPLLVAAAILAGSYAPRTTPPLSRSADADSLPLSDDSLAAHARQAIAAGRPWRATLLLTPVLGDSSRRTPSLLLLGAAAASAWEGWGQVSTLLAGRSWLDSLFDGRGRALLTRAALERGDDSLAQHYARLAVASARTPMERGTRMVLLARAFDERKHDDSAEAAYERSAMLLPRVADWLRLRAAAVSADSMRRSADYDALRTPAARARAPWVEAAARQRAGDLAGAADLYDSLGGRITALGLRLALPGDAERDSIRGQLVALIASRHSTAAGSRAAIALLDSAFSPLSRAEELTVARRAAVVGPLSRAAVGFSRGLTSASTSADRFTYGTVLARLGRDGQAAAQFKRVRHPRSLAARAAYQRARAVLNRGQLSRSRTILRDILHRYRAESRPASSALYLLADLATDERRDAAARDAFLTIAHRYPKSARAPAALFRAGLIALVAGHNRTAAHEFDSLRIHYPHSGDAIAATYWGGRAWERAGDTTRSHWRWRHVIATDPLSYYALTSSRRLHEPMRMPQAAPDSFPHIAEVDSAMARATLLAQIGLHQEAEFEYDHLSATATTSLDRLLATAAAFRRAGLAARAVRLARKALAQGAPKTAALYRLIYPLGHEDRLLAETRADTLDQALVAALIRQESLFEPHATSRAGARGLMQVMPSVGRGIADALGYPLWESVLLYQPDVNLQIGCTHLANMLHQYGGVARALAAYNAGGSRVDHWSTKRGTDDTEVFIERIPFAETRNYVRIIERNRAMYRGLYGW